MNEADFDSDWRQVRVFMRDFTDPGFHSFHAKVTFPLVKSGLQCPLFVSHYRCSDIDDSADTNISALPPSFRMPDQRHQSVRVRFRNVDGGENRFVSAIPTDCWYSDFRDYDPIGDLASDRFCDYNHSDLPSRRHRAWVNANLLHFATLLYFDSLRPGTSGPTLETSNHQFNFQLHSPYQSVVHMILNPPLLG
jgi:hypothetical protein